MFSYVRKARNLPRIRRNIDKDAFSSDLFNRDKGRSYKARFNVNMMSYELLVMISSKNITNSVSVAITDG